MVQAYQSRVQLWADGFYATPGLHWDRATLHGKPFHYFAYGAAVAGLRVAWCNRTRQPPERLPVAPAAEIQSLAELPELAGLR